MVGLILGDWLVIGCFSIVCLLWFECGGGGEVVLGMDSKYTTYTIIAQTHPKKRYLKPFIIIVYPLLSALPDPGS